MIIIGNSNGCTWWWSQHLQNTEENERVSIPKIEGLASENINDLLLEIEAQGLGMDRKAKNPFWIAIINPGPKEHLTEQERDRAVEILAKERGLEGQPYFLVQHEKKGWKHWHVVWSRVDAERMRLIPDSFDAKICHDANTKIALELGLEKVVSPFDKDREEPRPPRAPKSWEMYRGMQTGIDPRDITAEVTELYQQSDSGPAFKAALELHGYELVTGKRGLLILDSAGKEHSLVKRIEGVNKKELDAFMQDVDREQLPTLEQAKGKFQERKIEGLEADRATVRDEIEWAEALEQAAIAREEKERRFIEQQPEPQPEKEQRAGGREKDFIEFSIQQQILAEQEKAEREQRASFAVENNDPAPAAKGVSARIGHLAQYAESTRALLAALDDHGIALARVTKDEAEQSYRTASFAQAVGNTAPVYREGEIVAVTLRGTVHRLNEHTTGQPAEQLEKHFSMLEYEPLKGLEDTKADMLDRAEQLGEELTEKRMERATNIKDYSYTFEERARLPIKEIQAGVTFASKIAAKALDVIAGAVEGLMSFFLFDGPKSKQQIEISRADRERRAYFASVEQEAKQERQRKWELERD